MTGRTRISVIIPCYHSDSVIKTCVSSIVNMGDDLVDEIIIVDNSEVSGDYAFSELGGNIRIDYLWTGKNLGYREAVNIGMAQAANEIVVISNPDVEVIEKETFSTLLDPVLQCSRVACVFPVIVHPEQRLNTFHSTFALPFLVSYAEWDTKYLPPTNITVQLFSGAFFLLRKSVFGEVGGFFKDIFMYNEEGELSAKFTHFGYTVVFTPLTRVFHQGEHSVDGGPHRIFLYRNWLSGSAILYSRMSADGFLRRLMWWMVFLYQGIEFSLISRSTIPVSVALLGFIRKQKLDSKSTFSLNEFWNFKLYLKEKRRLIKAILARH